MTHSVIINRSSISTYLEEIAPYIEDMSSSELWDGFIPLAFEVEIDPTPGANGDLSAVWVPTNRYKDLLATVRAGQITFSDLIITLYDEFSCRKPFDRAHMRKLRKEKFKSTGRGTIQFYPRLRPKAD
ncbi:MAG: hypothetical protein CVU71_01000 [Deltaproteobacteria bacterium HGW-Deltaproteobacteria-6]|jgi:hypothetical protein|nr:MAG: hypothetical protein CVU71_01000 [Deltaproteobacteria bacterium HGW-Deltaproteobacteria-6]